MRRFLSFTLGLIFGIVFLLGAFGLAMYTSVTAVHPNEIYSDLEKYLGDLGDVSLLQAYNNILKLYNDKTGGLTDGDLYSVGDFLADNHISTTDEETGEVTAFGIIMPKELLKAPLFEYFNTTTDEEGNTGVQRALKQIKLSAIPAVVNMFSSTDEGGEKIIADGVVEKLDEHSVYELLYRKTEDGEINMISNLAFVTEDIKLVDLIPSLNADKETDNILKDLLSAVGDAYIGKVIDDLTGDNNLFGMVGADGSLSAVGKLTFADILGEGDPLISSLLGAVCVADFVAEDGSFAVVKAMDKISIGGLFGVVKRPADVEIADTYITRYDQTKEDGSKGASIWVGTKDGNYYLSTNAGNADVDTTWYYGKRVCEDPSADHTHGYTCFDYLWHKECKDDCDDTTHEHVTIGESAKQYVAVENTSLYRTIANLKMSCLFNSEGAFDFDNFIKQFDGHTLDTIIKELLADNEVLNKVSTLLDLDTMTLSQLLEDGGFDTLLSRVTEVPIKEILDTFEVDGMDFITDIIGEMTISELVDGGFEDISIGGLLKLVKREMTVDSTFTIKDFTTTTEEGETVVELSVATKVDGEQTVYYLSTDYDKDADTTAEGYVAPTWYEGQLDCTDDTHTAFDNHTKDCFEYVLYQECKEIHDHELHDDARIPQEQEDGTIDVWHVKANALYNTLGNMTIGSIVNDGFDSLFDELMDMKLGDLLDTLGSDSEATGIMDALKDYSINELIDGAYETLQLGEILGYVRVENTGDLDEGSKTEYKDADDNVVGYVATIGGQIVMSFDGETWYNGKFACKLEEHTCDASCEEGCTKAHTHGFDCYDYLWYQKCEAGCGHEDSEHTTIDEKNHIQATGMLGAIAGLTIGDLTSGGNVMDTILDKLTLGDVLQSNLPSMLESLKDTPISQLSGAIEETKVGDLLGYKHNEVDVTDWTVVIENSVYKHGDGRFAKADEDKYYLAKFNCTKEIHTHNDTCGTEGAYTCGKDEHTAHTADCYTLIWYKECTCEDPAHAHVAIGDKAYAETTGIEKVLADKTINDLSDFGTILDEVTLGDVMEDKLPAMLESLRDVKIADLSTELEKMYVGDLLKYKRFENTDALDGTPTEYKDADNNVVGYVATIGGQIVMSLDGETWYNGKLTCKETSADHTHGFGCYRYVWYKECVEDGCTHPNTNHKEFDGIQYIETTGVESIIAGKTINELQSFNSILDEVTLGDVLDPVPTMLSKLKDTPITKIGDEIDKLVVADFLGYCHVEVDVTASGWTSVIENSVYQHTDGRLAKKADGKYYLAELACDKEIHAHDTTCGVTAGGCGIEEHAHTADCYSLKWYSPCDEGCDGSDHTGDTHFMGEDGKYYVEVVGITAKLAGKTLDELQNLDDVMNDLTLIDVFGSEDKVPSFLRSIANTKISNLDTAINTIYVGEFFKYERGNKLLVCTKEEHTHDDTCGTEGAYTCGKEEHTHNADLGDDNCCYEKKLVCDITSTGHTHDASCYIYGYEWWERTCDDAVAGHVHCTTLAGHVHDGSTSCCYTKATGITAKIANERLDTLSDIGETVKTFTLRDVLQDSVPDMLTSIADTPIGELNSALDGLYVGEMLKYKKLEIDGAVAGMMEYKEGENVVGYVATIGGQIVISTDEETWYKGKLTCKETSADHTHNFDCYGYVWYQECSCTDTTHHVVIDSKNYAEVDGMMAKIANKKVGNLGSIGDDIQGYTISDILGEKDTDSALIKALYDTPVGDIGSTMDTIQLGTAMGYYRKPITCTNTSIGHLHDDDCSYEKDTNGKVVWYKKCAEGCTDATHTHVAFDGANHVKVGAPQSAFVNSTLSGIGDDISNIKLGELINVDDGSSSMLRALKDTPIDGIGNAINTMALGTAMGFVRREIADTTSYTITIFADQVMATGTGTDALFVKKLDSKWYEAVLSCKDTTTGHTHTADCYDYVWYEKCAEGCTDATHTHVTFDGANHVKVGGLNAKMSNLTVESMNGNAFVEIVKDLSMRDLIDSGVLTFDDEEIYKLAIMSGCGCSCCTLAGYIASKTPPLGSSDKTAEQYYKECHGITGELTDEQRAHRDQWQDCTLTAFINALLAGI